jgi:hypothetical protein
MPRRCISTKIPKIQNDEGRKGPVSFFHSTPTESQKMHRAFFRGPQCPRTKPAAKAEMPSTPKLKIALSAASVLASRKVGIIKT